jgi:dTDP-glucose 4,6-dehydratase
VLTLLESDLDEILGASESAFASLRGAHVFMTGGTGFVGSWLTESFLWANRRLALGARLTLLTRDPAKLAPRFAAGAEAGALALAIGDVRTFDLDERPDVVINAATPTTGHAADPFELVDTIVGGARNVLRFAAQSGPIPVLFTSSGAVYGRQPPALERMPEDYAGAPEQLDPRFAYHEAKRIAELLHVAEGRRSGIQPKIARLFAFVGPYLPLGAHFAIGNFVRDAVRGGPIVVNGDGTPMRSYLYATDMTTWLWRILCDGVAERAYNIGSERAISIAGTARSTAKRAALPPESVEIRMPRSASGPPERYVPDTTRARRELALRETVGLEAAIDRTIRFCRQS